MTPHVPCAVLAAALVLVGCDHRSEGGSTVRAPVQAQPGMDTVAAIPLGDVVGGRTAPGTAVANPYHGTPEAVAQGRALFVKMNCAGCHGYEAKGAMGPNLTDSYWRYGGTPVQIFKSIYEGRPQGMPAWNPALPPDEIWKLVSYIQTLGGSYPEGALAASIQGDTPSTQYAPQVQRVLPEGAKQPTEPKPSGQAGATDARPDASGKP